MRSYIVALCLPLFAALLITECTASNHEKRLLNEIFVKNRYDAQVRPAQRATRNVTVHFGVALAEVEDLQERTGRLSYRLILRMWWRDYQLAWQPSDYGGINKIYLQSNRVWLPDIDLYNGISNQITKDVKVMVYSNGDVLWMPPAHFSSSCTHEFRSDSWQCPLYFRSWTHAGTELDIHPLQGINDMDMEELNHSPHWIILSGKGNKVMKRFPCCDEPFPTMEFLMKVRNRIGHPALVGRKRSVPFEL